jgi:glycosyltransferase involved in cell wall biosynthesis
VTGKRVVAAVGDVNDINCWSNIPYYFLQAGRRASVFDAGISINVKRLRTLRSLWNMASLMRGERYGGFQYTRLANDSMSRQVDWAGIDEVVSHAQLFPPYELMEAKGISFSHYIDFPLPCLFRDYQIAQTIGSRTARNALAREKDQYAAAEHVFCMSPWAARQVIEHCEVPARKVHALIPGANLPEALFDELRTKQEEAVAEVPDGKKRPLRIAFVGKIPLRKGLDRLVAAVRILRSRQRRVIVRVIGPRQNLFPNDPEVQHLGFIDKQQEPARLVMELQGCHLGALPSYNEAFGIAALEYLRCGLPSLLTRTGGLGDSIPPECGIILPRDCTALDIADTLDHLLRNPEEFARLRTSARAMAGYASWDRTLRELNQFWAAERTSETEPGVGIQ